MMLPEQKQKFIAAVNKFVQADICQYGCLGQATEDTPAEYYAIKALIYCDFVDFDYGYGLVELAEKTMYAIVKKAQVVTVKELKECQKYIADNIKSDIAFYGAPSDSIHYVVMVCKHKRLFYGKIREELQEYAMKEIKRQYK